MPRVMNPEARRRVMASIRKRDTRPELVLRAALRSAGLSGYRCHIGTVPGSPDVAFTRWRLAVFVDGVWWHGHPDWLPRGRRGPYWDAKIAGNVQRDLRVDAELELRGWRAIRIWDVDVLRDPPAAAKLVARALAARRAALDAVAVATVANVGGSDEAPRDQPLLGRRRP